MLFPLATMNDNLFAGPGIVERILRDGNEFDSHFFSDGDLFAWPSSCSEKELTNFYQSPAEVDVFPDKVNLRMNVGHFAPEEIAVKIVGRNVEVSAKHEKDDEGGFVRREFFRRCALPEDVDLDSVTSRLSDQGILAVSAPRMKSTVQEGISIPVQHQVSKFDGSSS